MKTGESSRNKKVVGFDTVDGIGTTKYISRLLGDQGYLSSRDFWRNRYQLLLSVLLFNNNETIQRGERLPKIKPLIDIL